MKHSNTACIIIIRFVQDQPDQSGGSIYSGRVLFIQEIYIK